MRRLPSLVRRSLRLAWDASRTEFLIIAATQLVGAVVVAVQVVMSRQLVGELVEWDSTGTGDVGRTLVVLAGLLGASSFLTAARFEQQFVLGELVANRATSGVLAAAVSVDLVEFESPEFHDRLIRAQANAVSRPAQLANGVLMVGSSTFALAGIAVGVLVVRPVFLVVLLVAYTPAWVATARMSRLNHRFSRAQTERDRRRAYLGSLLTSRRDAAELRVFDTGSFLRRVHDDLSADRVAHVRSVARRRLRLALVGSSITAALNMGVVALLVAQVRSGGIDVADAAGAATAVLLFAQRLQVLAQGAASLYESALFQDDYWSFVDAAERHRSPAPTAAVLPPLDTLVVDDVSFSYPGSRRPVVDGVSLRVRRGEIVAIVGENGSGKSTLVRLLAGIHRPDAGRVLWNGGDVTHRGPGAGGRDVSVLFQDPVRYLLTMRENVVLGRHDAASEEGRIRDVARSSSIESMVDAMPAGWDTLLGPEFQGGTELSGGQWQRLATARARFRDASLVILDEPSAALDPRSEADLVARLRVDAGERAVVLVSHRLSTVRAADRIYVMSDGRVVEQGSHHDLVRLGGRYASWCAQQAHLVGEHESGR